MVSYISKFVVLIIILTNQISLFGQSKQFISSGDVFGCRVFIKNNGQFDSEIPNEKTIKYGYVNGDEKVYFTPSGLSYVLEKKYELTEHQREAQEHGKAFNKKTIKKYYINMIWENANPNIQIVEGEKQSWYHSYGYEKFKSDCYKKITYKNVYNNIDIEYVLTNDKLNGIKYNVILHPNANINDLKIRYTGDIKGIKIKKGAVIIKTPLDDIIEHPPISSQKNNIIKTDYVLKNNIISFNFPNGYNSSEKLIIDPWVTSISNLTTNNYGYDVDYDFAGNLYVFGGITTYKIAKYNPAGILQWTFAGVVASPAWTSSGNYSYPLIGNFIVDKFSQKCYTGQGYFGSGTQIVRIDANGLYNNYITVQNNLWQECWDFGLKCSTGEILGFGGTNNANYTGSVINQTTGAVSPNSFNPIYSSPGQDVANNAIDDNGDVFVIYSSVQTTALNNKISKINATLNNNIWIAPSQYNTLVENDNKSSYVGSGLPVGSSNGFNCLSVNANYLFYYDGFNLAAYNKLNGTRIGFISIAGQAQRSMGGIAVDDCDNVYVGSNNLIKSYFFNGTTFIALPSVNVNAPTINKYIYDLKLDKNSNLLYASGSGFTGVFSAINSTTCSINQLSISSICNGANTVDAVGSLTTNISNPIISYTWTNSGNAIISQTNNSTSLTNTVTNLTNGIYTLLSQINAPCGPIVSQTININSISVTSLTTVCEGSNAILTATGSTTFTWSTGATTNSIIVNPSTTTSYTVTGAIGTCSNSAVSTVSVIPSPTITLTPTLSLICSGQTASLTSNGANTFTWSPSSTLSSNTGSVVTSTPSITTIYTVTGTVNTCTNSAVTTVSVSPSPTITLSPNTSICQGSGTSATLTANGASSYTWNSATNLSSATGSIVTANPNSTETYTVTGSLNSCTNTAVTTVSVIATPTLSINSSSATICPLESASLTVTGASNYTWSPISTLSSSSGSLVIASPSTTTTYTVLGSNGTCTNIAQAQSIITVTNNPIITSSNATICSSASANLSANGGATYTWSPATNLNTTTGSNVISTPTASIIYTVSGSSALGCIGSSSVLVTVIPTPTLTISSNSLNLCIVGQSSTLTANGANSYSWSPTTTIDSINTNTTIATPVNTTIYSVIGSNGFSPNICTSTQTIQINVGASSIPTVSPNDEICFGQSTTIYAIGGNTYHWSPTTGVYKPNDSTTIVKPSVSTIYTVTVSKNNLCPVTATIQVIVDPLPIVDAGKDSTINIDQDIVLTGTGNVDVGFLSPDGNPLICNWCPIVTVHPLESTCYTLEGFNTYGCRNTDVVCITITKEWDVFIPNAFTPNGDISNDYFIPKGYGIAQIDLSIYDRWGVCIFKELNTTLGWDGKYKGQLCQQGIYVYQVDIKAISGENTTKTGHVTLLSKLK